jgi:hypothetical protein
LNPEKFAFVVGVAVIAGGSLGLILHRLLPEKHVTGRGKDIVGVAVGLFTCPATFAWRHSSSNQEPNCTFAVAAEHAAGE